MFDETTLPLLLVILAGLSAITALCLIFISQGQRTRAVVAESDSFAEKWEAQLVTAAKEQAEYLADASYLAAASVDQLLQESTAYSALQQELSNLTLNSTDPEQSELLHQRIQSAANAAAALKESAQDFLAAVASTTSEVCLLDLRPAGIRLRTSYNALKTTGDFERAEADARHSSDMSSLAQKFIGGMVSLHRHTMPVQTNDSSDNDGQ